MGITAHHVPESAGRGQAHTCASAVACRRSRGGETLPAVSPGDKRCWGTVGHGARIQAAEDRPRRNGGRQNRQSHCAMAEEYARRECSGAGAAEYGRPGQN